MLSAIFVIVACGDLQTPDHYSSENPLTSDPEARLQAMIERASGGKIGYILVPDGKSALPLVVDGDPAQKYVDYLELNERVPYIPNGYRPGDSVPYMPGAGEPLLDSDPNPKLELLLLEGR